MKGKRRRLGDVKIRWKIFLSYVVLICVTVSAIGWFAIRSLTGMDEDRYIEALTGAMDRLAADIDNRLTVVEEAVAVLVWQTELRNILSKQIEGYTFSEQMQDMETLEKIIKAYPLNASVTIYTDSAAVYARERVNIFPKAESPYADAYERMAADSAQSAWTLGARSGSRAAGQPGGAMVYLRRIIHRTRLFEDVGYLAWQIDPAALNALLVDSAPTDHSAMRAISADGMELAASGALPKDMEGGLTLAAELPGHPGWQLICFIPAEDLYNPAREVFELFAPVIGVVLVVALLLSIGLSKGLTGRLTRLVAIMRGSDAGAEQIELADVRYGDEIGELQIAYNQMMQRNRRLIDQLYRVELLKREAELKALQAHINPHFLYNTLNTIHWMALEEGAPRVSGAVALLASYYRMSLKTAGHRIPLGEELEHARMYLEIQKYRLGGALDYAIDADPALHACPAVKLMLQPLVENAILHGIQHTQEQAGHIWVTARREGDTVRITVEDDGCGFADNPALYIAGDTDVPHFGIRNTDQRIKLAFGEAYGLAYAPRDGGGTVTVIVLPCREGD